MSSDMILFYLSLECLWSVLGTGGSVPPRGYCLRQYAAPPSSGTLQRLKVVEFVFGVFGFRERLLARPQEFLGVFVREL